MDGFDNHKGIVVLAATNRNLENAIRQNAFREDLYYRLNVFTLNVPPLRERSSDIALLINHFLDHFVASLGRGPLRVTDRAMDVLLGYPWPGNIRELRNVVERSMIMASDGVLRAEDLPVELQHGAPASDDSTLPLSLRAIEKQHIARMLGHTGGNKTEAARLLGIGLTTLYRKIEEYGL